MKPTKTTRRSRFFRDTRGVNTAEWVVCCAALLGGGAAIMPAIGEGTSETGQTYSGLIRNFDGNVQQSGGGRGGGPGPGALGRPQGGGRGGGPGPGPNLNAPREPGEPIDWQGAVPVWGPGRDAAQAYSEGRWIAGTVNAALAVGDFFVVVSAGKMLVREGVALFSRQAVGTVGREAAEIAARDLAEATTREAAVRNAEVGAEALTRSGPAPRRIVAQDPEAERLIIQRELARREEVAATMRSEYSGYRDVKWLGNGEYSDAVEATMNGQRSVITRIRPINVDGSAMNAAEVTRQATNTREGINALRRADPEMARMMPEVRPGVRPGDNVMAYVDGAQYRSFPVNSAQRTNAEAAAKEFFARERTAFDAARRAGEVPPGVRLDQNNLGNLRFSPDGSRVVGRFDAVTPGPAPR